MRALIADAGEVAFQIDGVGHRRNSGWVAGSTRS
jgi:hypothetical protein